MDTRQAPGCCPVCDGPLAITRLHCDRCGTSIEGRFQPSRLGSLSREQQSFVELFLKCRGNIKEVERELGISYPTVRGRLEAAIEALGYRPGADPPEEERGNNRRKEILEALARGEVTSEEAVRALKQTKVTGAGGGQ